MKKVTKAVLLLLAVVAVSGNAYSQGTIGFANNPLVPITDMTTGSATGPNTTVGLYWTENTSESNLDNLELGGTTPIFTSGIFNNGGAALTLGAATGTPVLVEIRAWDNGAASYEEALAIGTGNAGRSGALNIVSLGGGPTAAPNLVIQGGFSGFAITPIPEPSTIALGILGGLGAMVLLRRRK
jgi:hypothetical protein